MSYREFPRMMIIRGLLQVIIIYILCKHGDMYGYQLKRKVDELHRRNVPQGLIYTTLKRMVKNGLLNSYLREGRTYYTPTDGGRQFLRNHLNVLSNVLAIIHEILDYCERTSLS
ncbi:MAG: PadR family transcriptional regulator [Metallosphaera yellowstonensis]|jgi:Predicted transcriptional regulators|uniref:Putative transcriptional regulator n=1 Tax=Metallosphaera yellowstonensis MK1 TaxID=671065 RepID=H2C3B3_9CREN|nr:PadR family transcriptional regulator [Metallosphaera yellowstonensis]EHP70734.1 putative transcriptional regulator [Metallosphaera yellowstonensis MK1]